MNAEKIKKLQAQVAQVRIGGKGTPRRKKKVTHQSAGTDDKKLHATLKKLAVNPIQGIEEVNLFKNDGTVVNFINPRTSACLASNTFSVTGVSETKKLTEMLPGIISSMGPESIQHLKKMAMFNKIAENSDGNPLGTGLGPGLSDEAINRDDDESDIPKIVADFEKAINESTVPNSKKESPETETKEKVF